MKYFFLYLAAICVVAGCKTDVMAQPDNNMYILTIGPDSVSYDPSFKEAIERRTASLGSMFKFMPPGAFDSVVNKGFKSEREKRFGTYTLEYFKKMDFFRMQICDLAVGEPVKVQSDSVHLVSVVKDTILHGGISALHSLAVSTEVDYLIQIHRISVILESGMAVAEVSITVYDRANNKILTESSYKSSLSHKVSSPGDLDAVESAVKEAIKAAYGSAGSLIAASNPRITAENQLYQRRKQWIADTLLKKPYDPTVLLHAIPSTDTIIHPAALFYAVYNANKTAGIGFYADTAYTFTPKLPGFIKESNLFRTGKEGTLYYVSILRYDNKWYYNKYHYFNLSHDGSLPTKADLVESVLLPPQEHFFMNRSLEPDSAFWHRGLFGPDSNYKSYDPPSPYSDFSEHSDMEERRFSSFPAIVAKTLRKNEQAEHQHKDSMDVEKIFMPFYRSHGFRLSKKITDMFLLAPDDRSVILNPISITSTDGEDSLWYFVYVASTKNVYEWTYFDKRIKPRLSNKIAFERQVAHLIKSNFAFSTYDDPTFWNTYILKKENGQYKYLKKIE